MKKPRVDIMSYFLHPFGLHYSAGDRAVAVVENEIFNSLEFFIYPEDKVCVSSIAKFNPYLTY